MREKGLCARKRRRKAQTTDSNHTQPIAPNLVLRDFTAHAPNRKWVADVTYIETQEGWLYLAGVLDLSSRKIVGWAMDAHHDAMLVTTALQMALFRRQPEAGLIHHSDRGSEYTSKSYQELLKAHALEGSMSRKGDCYDNAVMESFWATLKEECFHTNCFKTRKEAKGAIFEYIEVFYNRKRKHSSLGYVSPVEYEQQEKQE